MMVSCPGCNHKYSLDESKLPAGGAMLSCLGCGNRWRVRPEPAAPPSPAREENPTTEASPDPATSASNTNTGRSAAAAPDSSGSFRQPVTCPKCGHLFPSPRPAAAASPPRRHVLLIEDQNYFAELAREALAGDCDTTVVANLAGARAAMQERAFDLVILDLGLEEGQDGAHLLGTLRKKSIPVLVFTARDETDLYAGVWETLKGAGATDILIKGVNVGEELRQKVRSLLSSPARA